jgi:hypothetical protein
VTIKLKKRMTTSRIQASYQNPKKHLILAQFSNSPWTWSNFSQKWRRKLGQHRLFLRRSIRLPSLTSLQNHKETCTKRLMDRTRTAMTKGTTIKKTLWKDAVPLRRPNSTWQVRNAARYFENLLGVAPGSSLVLDPWASRRREELLQVLDQLDPWIASLDDPGRKPSVSRLFDAASGRGTGDGTSVRADHWAGEPLCEQ